MPNFERVNISIVLGNSILSGAGTEMVVLNYIKYKPEWVNLTLIQSDILLYNNKNLTINDVPTSKNFRIYTVKATRFIKKPFLNILVSFYINKNIKKISLEQDIIYFPIQFMVLPFKKHKNQVFICAGHNLPLFNSGLKKLKIILYKIIYMKFDSFHQLFNNEASECNYKGNVFTIPNGVDTKIFFPQAKSIENKFLFVGRLEEIKGVVILIEAWKKAKIYDRASLVIVGNGPLEEYVKSNIQYNITYKKNISITELSEIYRDSDYLINPTMSDTFSMVTLEAFSSGLYILGSTVLKKIYSDFKDNLNIEFLEPNIDLFSNKIRELFYSPPEIWDRFKQYKFINENFSWEIIANKFYSKLISIYNEFKK